MNTINTDPCNMEIWIFSYNRGRFLQNCIESAERCLPEGTAISVFDDCSDDFDTQQLLDVIRQKHRVVQPSNVTLKSKHGGLYGNLQSLIDSNEVQPKFDLVCCIQDDTQFVRTVHTGEVAEIHTLFNQRPNLGFIQPAFLRGCNEPMDAHRTRFDPEVNGYYVDRYNNSAGAFYSDIFISKISRLQSADWKFSSREAYNEKTARSIFEQMVYLRNPFTAWLPNVPAFRGKRRTLAMKVAQKKQKSDFYPIEIMDPEASIKLLTRESSELPYAENFLNIKSGNIKTPWQYYPLQGQRWLKRLNQLELALHKLGW